MIAEHQLARRAIRAARRRWGPGWAQLAPAAQTYQAYAAAFVLVTTRDLRPHLRRLADEIIRQLHGDPA